MFFRSMRCSRSTKGVATSQDLRHWTVVDEPLITATQVQREFGLKTVSNIYPSGAAHRRDE